MIQRIDPHVHFRDGRQAYKETIAHGLALAEQQGVYQVFDMPNTDPPIIRENDVVERLKLVPKGQEGRYRLYIGVTGDPEQLREAVDCYDRFEEVVGLKEYAGSSTGSLLVATEAEQRKVDDILHEIGYGGVLAVHSEKESLMQPELWNPWEPCTHCLARPVESEVESVRDQIRFADEAGFKGNLHICHISCYGSVLLVNEGKEKGMKVTCGVTPHHLLWTEEMMNQPDGLIYKMNPPLRGKEHVVFLRRALINGDIDWIETDHAPHSIGDKLHFTPKEKTPSGYPSLYLYKTFLNFLKSGGMSDAMLDAMTCGNIKKAFGRKLA